MEDQFGNLKIHIFSMKYSPQNVKSEDGWKKLGVGTDFKVPFNHRHSVIL